MMDPNRRPAIDLTRHHFVRHIGDVSIYGSWIYNEDQEKEEPALVIIPRYRRSGFKPCVIALSAAYKYNSPDQRYLAGMCKFMLAILGMEDSLANASKLGRMIHDHLGDLLSMPNSPTTSIIVADGSVTVGGKTRSIEIMDHTPTPQA